MQALRLTACRRLELSEVPVPAFGPEDVLVRIRACGICGSDVHGMDGSTGRRIPPLIMGHEAAGEIVDRGRAVAGWNPGDRVTFDSTISCGDCGYCRRGEINLCDRREVLGVSCGDYRRDGAFAEYVAIPARILYRLPDSLSFDQAALIEAVAVALHAVRLTPVAPGDTAAVVGCGMIGNLVIQAAKAAGFARVTAVDLDPARLALAHAAGADVATEIRGADAVFEAVGLNASVATAITAVRKGGVVTLIGNLNPQVDLPLQAVVSRQIRLQGSCASAGEYPDAIDLVARGVIRVDHLISARTTLAGAPEWFERLYRREDSLMKVIVEP